MMTVSNGEKDVVGRQIAGSWHVGEDVNLPKGYVLQFSFDGDELQWLVQAFARDGYWVNYPAKRLTPIY